MMVLGSRQSMRHRTSMVLSSRLVKAAHEAQEVASKALEAVLSLMGALPKHVKDNVDYAKKAVDDPNCTADIAAKALLAISHACQLDEVNNSMGEVNTPIKQAVKSVRDFFIWKTQLQSPLGDRDAFVAALTAAVGATVINPTMLSRLMQSHKKAVCSRFPSAFRSNAAAAGRKRKARRRGKCGAGRLEGADRFLPLPCVLLCSGFWAAYLRQVVCQCVVLAWCTSISLWVLGSGLHLCGGMCISELYQ